ncbi:hypothetical protein ACFY30_19690 [Streptomyces sp. NPDC000345]|uniref:hypothetical protein n=1 Tax=Streptomyces sp. NPDC000345 TaxID=3364537 RepID=UPI0036743F38
MDNSGPVEENRAAEWYGRPRMRTDDLGPAGRLTRRTPGHGAFGTVAGVAAPGFAERRGTG